MRLTTLEREDRGETLIELVIAIAVLGVAGVAILASMAINVQASAINRNQAGGGAYLRSGAEAIQRAIDGSGKYASCADATSATKAYTSAANSVISSTDVSAGYSVAVVKVEFWKGSAIGWKTCAGVDVDGTQRVQLRLTTPGDAAHGSVETMYVVLRKPCDAAGANPCT